MNKRQRPGGGDFIDASPGGDDGPPIAQGGGRPLSPRTLQDTRAWKDGVGGAKSAWHTYLNMLSGRFRNTPRAGQEAFILRMSQAITIGSAGLIALFVYPFLPTLVRVFALPVVLVLSWLLGTKLVAPQMMSRVESYLNQSDFYPE